MYRAFTLILIWTMAVSLTAYPQAQPQKPAAAAPQEEAPPVMAVPKDYHYNQRGRRDPFLNPVPKPVVEPKAAAAAAVVAARPPGLKGVLVAEAEIAGIVVSREPSMNVVTIAAPGNKKYFARIGDALFDATVKSIKADSVTFALTNPGTERNSPREIERKMRPLPGEHK